MMWHFLDKFWQQRAVYVVVLTVIALATPLAFAPFYHFWLMPLLFGALIRLTELKPNRRVLSAYWFGLVAYTVQFWWVHTALHDVSGLSNVFAIPLTFLLPAFLALFPAMAFWVWEKYTLPRGWSVGVALPILWTLAEFARERVFTGFGWGALGYSQITSGSPLAAFAPIGGIHLVTLMTTLVAAWLVLVVNHDGSKKIRGGFAMALCVVLGLGFWAREWRFTQPVGAPVSVALAQGNIAQSLKFDEKTWAQTYQRYYEQVSYTRAQIVVLPETAFPQFLQTIEPGLLAQFADVAQRNGSALAVGVPALTPDGDGYLNMMVNLADFDPDEPHRFQSYSKNHLVPFGEYKPLPALTEPLYRMMNMPLSDFKRGGKGQLPFDMAGQKVAFNICYEDGFGDELIESARTSTMLANSSNMAWYGDSNAMWQQLQQSQARALELGRFMIRATNTGATAIVSPRGEIVRQLPPNQAGVLEGEVQGMVGETPYMKMGGSVPLVVMLALIAVALWAWGYARFRLPKA